MAEPPPFDDLPSHRPDDAPDLSDDDRRPFNPLSGDLNDLRVRHEHTQLWPEISCEFDRLDALVVDAHVTLAPLTVAAPPGWAVEAALGLARSNAAIHQHAETHGSYIGAARSLWTTRIPREAPTLSDAQIYALLAICEARQAAESYCELAAGVEDELEQTGIDGGDEEVLGWLRAELAGWERNLWHTAAHYTGDAERFLLMAGFAATSPASAALDQAEAQLATLHRRASTAEAVAAPFRRGRQRGAVGRLGKALLAIVAQVGSRNIDDVLSAIYDACHDFPIAGIQFQDYNDVFVFYLDVITKDESKIKIASLKRQLARLPDV